MGNLRNVWIGVGALAALFLWVGPALGQEKPPVSPSASSGPSGTVEPPAASPAGPPAQVMVLSLKERILLGLKNNLDIAIEGFNPKIREADVTVAKAVFDPAAFAEIFFSKSKLQNRSGLALNAVNENEDIDGAAGGRPLLPPGAPYERRHGAHRDHTNTTFLP